MNEKGCTQDDIARSLGVAPSAVSHWYMGLSCPRSETLMKLANFFMVAPSTLMGSVGSFAMVDEEKLLRGFRMLSPKGKELALERIEELKQLHWYDK